jgi:hypothetical protein
VIASDFFDWANTFFIPVPAGFAGEYSPAGKGYLNTLIHKKHAFKKLQEKLTDRQRKNYNSANFKQHLTLWCKHYGYRLNPETLINDKKTTASSKKQMAEAKNLFLSGFGTGFIIKSALYLQK